MKMTKLAVVAAGLIAAAAVTFTSCDGVLGKDDFFGTWKTSYEITAENALAADDPAMTTVAELKPNSYIGSTIDLTMYFDGKDESLIQGGKSAFWQFKIRKNKDGSIGSATFWCGLYKLADNANYEHGTLTLTYNYGVSLDVSKYKTVEACEEAVQKYCDAWSDFKNFDEEQKGDYTTKEDWMRAHATTKYDGTVDKYPANFDVEVFDFELSNQSFLKGYQSMKAVAKSGVSWEVKERSFDLVSTDSILKTILDALDDAEDKE